MMVNSHLTIQQTEALAGLEGLQAAPGHGLGCRLGQPSAAGTRAGKGLAPGGAGRPAGSCGGWGVGREWGGVLATAPPSGLKGERRSPSKKAGTKARRQPASGKPEGRRSGNSGERAPQSPTGAAPGPAQATTSHTQPGPLPSGPFLGPPDLRFLGHRTHSPDFTSRGLRTHPSPPVPPFRSGGGQPVLIWTVALQPRSHRHPPTGRLCPLAPP